MLLRVEDIGHRPTQQPERKARVLTLFSPEDAEKHDCSSVIDEALKPPNIGTGKKTFDYFGDRQKKKTTKKPQARPQKPKPRSKPTKGKIAKRTRSKVRPSAKPGGIPRRAKPEPTVAPSASNLSQRDALKKAKPDDIETWPANWKTTAPGPRIPMPAQIKQRKRKGRAVNQSDFYKHVVRAIYNTGTQTGYPFRGTAAKSSQAIARGKMIKWKYARRAKKKGGVPDRYAIALTGAGVNRNKRKHRREPRVVRIAKDRDYQAIVAMDPL